MAEIDRLLAEITLSCVPMYACLSFSVYVFSLQVMHDTAVPIWILPFWDESEF